ncbi:hypothetical protein FHL15_006702 [Xylaria flabelliformis]|uniref:Uncharacterized protein n=1 Tax=Xylaria flabelliformis TaxID=2512241 RepID=A0A553HWI8_9PEZI|nr:hypothetical protein FHL15_006702 [Xylaria flabelliformis]
MGYIPQNALAYSRHPGLQEPIIPLRTQFYDASNVLDRDRPTTKSPAQLKTSNTKSSSFKVVSNAAQLASQYTADKTLQRETSLASQSQPLNKPANNKEKGFNKRSNDTNHETPAPPIKFRLVSRRTDHSKASSQPVYNISTSTLPQADRHASQECQPSQVLPETLEGDSVSGGLDPVGVNQAHQNIETKITSSTPISLLEYPHRTQVNLPPYSHQNRSSTPEILSQPPIQSSLIGDEHMESNALAPRMMKRSASQATTASGTTTQPSYAAEDEDVPEEEKESFNPMSMVDETMILERDLSDIVDARLREGKPELLDTLYGEILIKMALKDEGLFKAVSKMLQS